MTALKLMLCYLQRVYFVALRNFFTYGINIVTYMLYHFDDSGNLGQ